MSCAERASEQSVRTAKTVDLSCCCARACGVDPIRIEDSTLHPWGGVGSEGPDHLAALRKGPKT